MGILSIISIILTGIKLIPSIISLIKSIIEMIHELDGREGFDKKLMIGELKAALKDIKSNKDPKKLEDLYDKLAGICEDCKRDSPRF